MFTERNEPNESRSHFNIAVAVAAALAIVPATSVNAQDSRSGRAHTIVLDGDPVPNDEWLTEFLRSNNFNMTLHVKDGGALKVVGADGVEGRPCALIRGDKIVPLAGGEVGPECPPIPKDGITLESLELHHFFTVKINPICFGGGGYLFCW